MSLACSPQHAPTPRTRIGSPGQGKVGCLVWAGVLALVALIAWKAIPVKMTDVEFGDFIEQQAQFAGRSSGETIKKRILERAKELDIPLDPKKLTVQKSSARVRIHCTYSVELDFSVYVYEWNFEHSFDRPIFII